MDFARGIGLDFCPVSKLDSSPLKYLYPNVMLICPLYSSPCTLPQPSTLQSAHYTSHHPSSPFTLLLAHSSLQPPPCTPNPASSILHTHAVPSTLQPALSKLPPSMLINITNQCNSIISMRKQSNPIISMKIPFKVKLYCKRH